MKQSRPFQLEASASSAAGFYEDRASRYASNEGTVRDAKFRAACMYRKIAQYHFMFDKDLDAYETWMDRFRQTLPKERATLSSADWHGIIRGGYR